MAMHHSRLIATFSGQDGITIVLNADSQTLSQFTLHLTQQLHLLIARVCHTVVAHRLKRRQ